MDLSGGVESEERLRRLREAARAAVQALDEVESLPTEQCKALEATVAQADNLIDRSAAVVKRKDTDDHLS